MVIHAKRTAERSEDASGNIVVHYRYPEDYNFTGTAQESKEIKLVYTGAMRPDQGYVDMLQQPFGALAHAEIDEERQTRTYGQDEGVEFERIGAQANNVECWAKGTFSVDALEGFVSMLREASDALNSDTPAYHVRVKLSDPLDPNACMLRFPPNDRQIH